MSTRRSRSRRDSGDDAAPQSADEGRDVGDGEETDVRDVLRELESGGCNLLVVGDAPRHHFTRASASLLGGTDERRYRLLAITDASKQSVAERLPDPDQTPGSFAETTSIVNHASPPRSIAADVEGSALGLDGVAETRVVDPQLGGLQAKLVEAMATFDRHAGGLAPRELRVGLDSLDALLEHYDDGVVRRGVRVITGYVEDYDGMGHYVLPQPYESDRARSLAGEFDAIVEIRAVDPATHDHDAEERWHVPDRGVTTGWMPL